VSNNQLNAIENITNIDMEYDYVHDMHLRFWFQARKVYTIFSLYCAGLLNGEL